MENQVEVFENSEFGKVRVVAKDGEPWFVAADVCRVLEIKNTSDALAKLDNDEKMTLDSNEGHSGHRGGAQKMNVVNEPGLYSLVLGSRKPQAKAFKRWITHDVIPSIRKHGGYIVGQEQMDREQLVQAAQAVAERVLSEKDALRLKLFDPDPLEVVNAHKALVEMEVKPLREKIEADAPKVRFAEVATKSPVNIRIREMAKILCDKGFDTGEKRLFALLRSKGVLMDDNLPYQQYIDRGYFVVRESPVDVGAFVKLRMTTLVTPRGQIWIANKAAGWLGAA